MAAGEYPHWRNCTDNQRPGCMLGFLDKTKLYGTHILRDASDAYAWKYDLTTGSMDTVLISTLVSNAIDLPIYFPDDAHYGLLTAVDALDGVHIIGNSQLSNSPPGRPSSPTTTMHHIVCTNVADFTNPASWVQGDEPMAGTDAQSGRSYTYHWIDRFTNGDLAWVATQVDTSSTNVGRDNVMWATNGGHTFTQSLGAITGVAATEGVLVEMVDDAIVGGANPDVWYTAGYIVQPGAGASGSDRIHMTGLARYDWTDPTTEQNAIYMYSDTNAFGSWFAGDGTPLTVPITAANWTAALIPSLSGTGIQGWNFMQITGTGAATMCYTNGATAGVGGTLTEYTISPAGTWTNTAMPAIAGDMVRKWRLIMNDRSAVVWYSSTASNRVALTRGNLTQTVRLGPSVLFAARPGSQYPATHAIGPDPILYREQGYLACNIGEGNTPRIYFFPDRNGYRIGS